MGEKMAWPEKFPIIQVVWEDTSSHPDWHDKQAVEEFVTAGPYLITSIGFLVNEAGLTVILAQSRGEHCLGELLKIPKTTIRERWELPPNEEGAN